MHALPFYLGTWSTPVVKGTRPKPCGDVTITAVDEQRAVFYGGRKAMYLYLIKCASETLVNNKITFFFMLFW